MATSKYFFIQSRMHHKVIEIKHNDPRGGAKVVMMDQDRPEDLQDSQLWYEDVHGIIRSKLNHFAMDGYHYYIRMQYYDPNDKEMQWKFGQGGRICLAGNESQVLDIKSRDRKNWAELIQYPFHGKPNQLWNKVPHSQ